MILAKDSGAPWYHLVQAKPEITIRIDDDILEWFREQAHRTGWRELSDLDQRRAA